jgi:hypothetical protein
VYIYIYILEKRESSYFNELGAVDDSVRLSCRLLKLKELSEELPGKEFGVLRRLCNCFCCPPLIIFLKLQFDCNSFLDKHTMTLHHTKLESQTHMALNTYSPFHNTNAKAQKFTFVTNPSIIHIKAQKSQQTFPFIRPHLSQLCTIGNISKTKNLKTQKNAWKPTAAYRCEKPEIHKEMQNWWVVVGREGGLNYDSKISHKSPTK